MLKNKYFLVGFLWAFLNTSCAFAASLTLDIEGHDKKTGQLHIAVYQVKGALTDKLKWDDLELVHKLTELVDADQAQQPKVKLAINDLPIGFTCIRLYLDLNNNQLLERSSMGIPLEPVGFSNNPSLFKGEPIPLDSCFLLQQSSNIQNIKLKHHKKRK
ncbi:MAG: DUF2141 domain-containing protein [Paraglaciecola sp.]|uniref:DUF2141 domain-containing protein n=1 Tax=Paraglaciecola sp. TaxID=1920173 RepID=UPI00329A446F